MQPNPPPLAKKLAAAEGVDGLTKTSVRRRLRKVSAHGSSVRRPMHTNSGRELARSVIANNPNARPRFTTRLHVVPLSPRNSVTSEKTVGTNVAKPV